MTIHGIAALAVAAACAATPAFAQTANEPRLSMNLGTGAIFAADPAFDGAVVQISIGTDERLSPRWDLRIEAAGRAPAWQEALEFTRVNVEGAPLDVATDLTKRTIADLSLLARRYWIGERAEGALLVGAGLNIARYTTPGCRAAARIRPISIR